MGRDEAFGWNEAEVPLKACFLISLDSPPLLLPKKGNASLCYCVSTLPGAGCSYHSALPLSPPSKCFSGDAACRHLSLCLSLSEPLSVPFGGASPSALFFSPQTIHVGGLENQTERVGGPRRIEANFKYVCWTLQVHNTFKRSGMDGWLISVYLFIFFLGSTLVRLLRTEPDARKNTILSTGLDVTSAVMW